MEFSDFALIIFFLFKYSKYSKLFCKVNQHILYRWTNKLIFSTQFHSSPNETGSTASKFVFKNSMIPK